MREKENIYKSSIVFISSYIKILKKFFFGGEGVGAQAPQGPVPMHLLIGQS